MVVDATWDMAALGRAFAILILLPALAGGAQAQAVDCRVGQKPGQVAELMFGRNVGARTAVSKVVQIVLPGHDDDMTRLSEIAETYKARFKQQSVITIVRPACVSF